VGGGRILGMWGAEVQMVKFEGGNQEGNPLRQRSADGAKLQMAKFKVKIRKG
jgi:hypothetical protein